MTTHELYEFAVRTARKIPLSQSSIDKIGVAMRKCYSISDRPYVSIDGKEMNDLVLNCPSYSTRSNMKRFFKLLDAEADRRSLPGKRYSGSIVKFQRTENDVTIPKHPLNLREIKNLIEHPDKKDAYIPLILLFTGMRPVEMRHLTTENLFIDSHSGELFIKGGAKTQAGKNRVIPVHPQIKSYILNAAEKASEPDMLLFPNEHGRVMDKKEFTLRFKMAITGLTKPGHTPYDMRHTFCSELDNNDIPYNIINFLMGHKQYNEGDSRYKHLQEKPEKLISAILSLYTKINDTDALSASEDLYPYLGEGR